MIKDLIVSIKKLNPKEKSHILNILIKHNIEYTKNSNGYFFNLKDLDEDLMTKLIKCIELIEKNRNILTELDKKRNEYLNYYKMLIDSELNNSYDIKKQEFFDKILLREPITYYFIKKRLAFKKINDNQDTDVDVLMKEYNKRTKYPKNTVYFRINSIMSNRKNTNKNTSTVQNDDDIDTENDKGADNDNDVDVVDVGETEFEDNLSDIEEEEIEDLDTSHSDFEEINNESIEECIEESIEECIEEGIVEGIEEDLETETTVQEQKNKRFAFYKNLLKEKHGYVFDDNKNVVMKIEEYI